jgi:hypothetical protein
VYKLQNGQMFLHFSTTNNGWVISSQSSAASGQVQMTISSAVDAAEKITGHWNVRLVGMGGYSDIKEPNVTVSCAGMCCER